MALFYVIFITFTVSVCLFFLLTYVIKLRLFFRLNISLYGLLLPAPKEGIFVLKYWPILHSANNFFFGSQLKKCFYYLFVGKREQKRVYCSMQIVLAV